MNHDQLVKADAQLEAITAAAIAATGALADGDIPRAAGILDDRTPGELVLWAILEQPEADIDQARRMAGPGSRDTAALWATIDSRPAPSALVAPSPAICTESPDRGRRLEAVIAAAAEVRKWLASEQDRRDPLDDRDAGELLEVIRAGTTRREWITKSQAAARLDWNDRKVQKVARPLRAAGHIEASPAGYRPL